MSNIHREHYLAALAAAPSLDSVGHVWLLKDVVVSENTLDNIHLPAAADANASRRLPSILSRSPKLETSSTFARTARVKSKAGGWSGISCSTSENASTRTAWEVRHGREKTSHGRSMAKTTLRNTMSFGPHFHLVKCVYCKIQLTTETKLIRSPLEEHADTLREAKRYYLNLSIRITTTAIMPRCTICSKTYSEGTLRDHRASSHLGVVCYFPHTSYPDLPAEDDEEMTRRLMEANSQRGGGQSGDGWVCRWHGCRHSGHSQWQCPFLACPCRGTSTLECRLVLRLRRETQRPSRKLLQKQRAGVEVPEFPRGEQVSLEDKKQIKLQDLDASNRVPVEDSDIIFLTEFIGEIKSKPAADVAKGGVVFSFERSGRLFESFAVNSLSVARYTSKETDVEKEGYRHHPQHLPRSTNTKAPFVYLDALGLLGLVVAMFCLLQLRRIDRLLAYRADQLSGLLSDSLPLVLFAALCGIGCLAAGLYSPNIVGISPNVKVLINSGGDYWHRLEDPSRGGVHFPGDGRVHLDRFNSFTGVTKFRRLVTPGGHRLPPNGDCTGFDQRGGHHAGPRTRLHQLPKAVTLDHLYMVPELDSEVGASSGEPSPAYRQMIRSMGELDTPLRARSGPSTPQTSPMSPSSNHISFSA
ncbi:hypothetical protein F4821DRAFT_260766 [Hypoxylon rubiginosum]|uniref:Uncharacterized protein n=1 Tax=Hypoxylon rubiginosum TaxID=110542 RepID=A0ACC0CYX3_9PEZI|nr:hypothetical protein F4821DRAFT_260766 [Hypoxylon rubiginosum]